MGQFEVIEFLKKRKGRFFSYKTISGSSIHAKSLSFHKIRKRASFYGVQVKVKRNKKRIPIFLIGFPKN